MVYGDGGDDSILGGSENDTLFGGANDDTLSGALGYDVLFVLSDAVKRCDDPKDPDKLGAAIAATKGVKGITGTMDLTTPDRTPIKDAVIVKVDGGLKFHATIPAK